MLVRVIGESVDSYDDEPGLITPLVSADGLQRAE